MKRWAPVLVGLLTAAIGYAIAWHFASADISKEGDWRNGAARFIAMAAAVGGALGFGITLYVTRGVKLARDGFTLSYRPADPVPDGYRELKTLTVGDLVERLKAVGYAPVLEACDELGERTGAKPSAADSLIGTNVALVDPGVKGWVRLQLPAPAEGQKRALGLVEIWSERGESAEELALFTMRVMGELVGNLAGSRESSRTSEDPVAMLTAGLADRPQHRAGSK